MENITLKFTAEQADAIHQMGFNLAQTHRQHPHNDTGDVFVYENEEDEMILWVFSPDGNTRKESRLFNYDSGWEREVI